MNKSEFRPLSVVPLGLTLSTFFAVTYVLCILAALLLQAPGMRMAFEAVIPGFVWLDATSVLFGLLWSAALGWYVAILFVPIRNYFFRRFA